MPIVANYLRFNSGTTKASTAFTYNTNAAGDKYVNVTPSFFYIPVNYIQGAWVDKENGQVTVVPVKTTLQALYGTQSQAGTVGNIATPTGNYEFRLIIHGELFGLLGTEYGSPNDPNTYTSPTDDLSGYKVKNNLIKYLSMIQHLSTSNNTVFNYANYHGTDTTNADGDQISSSNFDREFQGVVTGFTYDDSAGEGTSMDFPCWTYTLQFAVTGTVPAAVAGS